MRYLILSRPSVAYARAISAHLYRLTRPDHARSAEDVSAYWCGWLVHPSTGAVALVMPDEDIPVHTESDADLLVQAVAHAIPPAEAEKLRVDILATRGTRAAPLLFVPQSAQTQLRTHSQMEADGWFATPAEG